MKRNYLKSNFSVFFDTGLQKPAAEQLRLNASPTMRGIILTVFASLLCLGLSAQVATQTIHFKDKHIHLKQVFSEIKRQTGYVAAYNQNLFKEDTIVSVPTGITALNTFLDQLCGSMHVNYRIEGHTIFFYSKEAGNASRQRTTSPETVQTATIHGKVLTADGSPAIGASISLLSITGATLGGAITDEKGGFVINASPGDSLIVSYLGFETKRIRLSGDTTISIILSSAANSIGEIVVTALGIKKQEKNLGYAVTTVSSDLFDQAKEPNIANSLTGRVPGLNVSGVSSGPGSSARILIRGMSNFSSGTTPLIVIDGVPMSNSQNGSPGLYGGADMGDGISSLNPDDIESITVLNGSTASALWGTRALNGVIEVTTKSGKGAKGFGVEFTSNLSFNRIINYSNYQKVFGQGINGERPQTVTDVQNNGLNSWGGKMDGSPVIGLDGKMHPYSPVSNQLDKFYRTAPVFINTVSVVQGGEKGNMRFSLSHTDNESVIPNSNLKRYSANLNVVQNITGKLKVSVMVNYLNEKVKNRPFLNDMSRNPNWTMLLLPANISPADLKPGYFPANNPANELEAVLSSDGYVSNPWFAAYKDINNTNRNRITSAATARYDFSSSLYVQGRLGLDYINDGALNIEPIGIGFKPQGSLQEQSQARTTELNIDALGGYTHDIARHLTLNAAIGISQRQHDFNKIGYTGGSNWLSLPYTVGNLGTPAQALKPSNYGGALYNQSKTNSTYYSADFTYKGFLTIGTTGRWDWFSEALSSNLPIFTPSVSGSFLFGDLVNLPQLSFAKLRASYAETSGEPAPYQTQIYYLNQGTNGGTPFGVTNPQVSILDIAPFKMKEFEVGLELKWFNDRLGLDATYFTKRTNNEPIAQTISIASGATSIYEPLGSTANKGLELKLKGTPLKTKDFQWNVSLNFTDVHNKLVSDGDSTGKQTIAISGEGQYRPYAGPFNTGAFVASQQGLPLEQIYAYDYRYDGDGNIVLNSGIPMRGNLKAMGSGLPRFYGGFNNDFHYKNFDLGFLIDYRFGCKVLSATDFLTMYYGLNKNTLPGRETGIIAKGVTPDGKPNNILVPAQSYYQGLATNVTTISVYDGSFIKLRQVTLGYQLPAQLLQNSSVFQSINISFVARNLLTLLKHTPNFDPEDSYSPLPGNAGLQSIGIPPTRTFGVNVSVRFKN